MILNFFQDYIQRQKYGIVIYPANFFELRIQEEMVRADDSKSFFVYAEFDFETIRQKLSAGKEEVFWKAVLKSFATTGRGSDVIGMLEKNRGVGLLLLDSKMNGWKRLRESICECCKDSIGDIEAPLRTVKAFVYPAHLTEEISKESDAISSEAIA